MTYGKKDFQVGDILTTKRGLKYVLVFDQNGEWGVLTTSHNDTTPFLSNRISFKEDGTLFIEKKLHDNGTVVCVERFDCESTFNRLSEAMKFASGIRNVIYLYKVWSIDHIEARPVKEAIEKLKKEGYTVADILAQLA